MHLSYNIYSGSLREVLFWKLNPREWSMAPFNSVFIREKI